MDAEGVLAGLDPEQRAVAEAVRGPVCVLAGAGTGKTRAITHRIAYATLTGVVAPQQVLAVTFTTRAAGELRGRLRQLGAPGVQARTFHAAALRQLSYFWPKVVGGDPPKIIESKLPVVADAARAVGLSLGRTELRDVAGEIEWAKVTQRRPEDYAAAVKTTGRKPPADVTDIAHVYAVYEQLRRERNLLDFEGMLELTVAVLLEHPEVARQVHDQYRYFVVDEFQDVNPLQRLLLDTWLGGRKELCVVGDPNQTIYSFTGATPSYLLDFPQEFPDAKVIKLVRDYRSTPQVVRLANTVIGQARSETARRHRLELTAQREDGPEPVYSEYDDEVAEADDVARRCRKLIDEGVPAREIAVLFRINAQSETYEQALSAAGVPYVLRGAERFFERPEVREAVIRLRAATRGTDAETEGMGLIQKVRHVLLGAGFTNDPPEGAGAARARWESLAALAQLAEDMAADNPAADLPDFVTELEERAAAQHAPPLEGVTLASLHAAKGLEWDAVFLVGLVEGTLPIIYAETPDQVEEERRLFYVGITRAREHLGLSWALARSPGGPRFRRPSRFLEGVTTKVTTHTPARADRAKRRTAKSGPQPCRVCGRPLTAPVERKLGRCEDCPAAFNEDLLLRLKEWRTETAADQRIPAYVVFTDATLQAIAERDPATLEELAQIPGVGKVKLDKYGEAVLSLCGGG
ncbi:ATP-dependent DNA helicase UvrD2 [Actinomadura kijaniata]|uniref:ATP-dependent DNA helicase UvrD2 n=1 Tax=Actinomadura kijaniata TaxID=46161 RepID=UPI003F1AAF77